jgi:hypothetical protein
MIAGSSRPAVPLGGRVSATRPGDSRSLSSSRKAGPGAADVATRMPPPHRAGRRLPGPPPGPVPAGGSLLPAGIGVGDAAGARRAAIADLEVQRIRLAALAELLLELGRRGEASAARNIADGLTRVVVALSA